MDSIERDCNTCKHSRQGVMCEHWMSCVDLPNLPKWKPMSDTGRISNGKHIFPPTGPDPRPIKSEEHTGGSSSYYTVRVEDPTSSGPAYTAECNDIIESLNLTFAEANVLKAIWRTATARRGKKKKGNNEVYDAEKVVFFAGRILNAAKRGNK